MFKFRISPAKVVLGIFFAFFLSLALAPTVGARVIDVKIHPKDPVQGDWLKVSIEAGPNEEVEVSITIAMEVGVSDGKYELRGGVEVPSKPNRFTITARNVRDLSVSVKVLFWVTKSVGASDGVASLSHSNVPPGAYEVIIRGGALEGSSSVHLQMTAWAKVTTDQDGRYEFSRDTGDIPPSIFTVRADGVKRTVTLREPSPPPPLPPSPPPSIQENVPPENVLAPPENVPQEELPQENIAPEDMISPPTAPEVPPSPTRPAMPTLGVIVGILAAVIISGLTLHFLRRRR